jgi:crotonobetainyl-CoA:carnitine CoA-transferase CaiB-like acyl-CoA transferase
LQAVLDGIRVLDFGRYIAAPLCASFLAELGADVVRIEPPEGADDRYLMQVIDGGEGASYLHCNRGKRALALDVAAPAGKAAAQRLIAQADVVLVSFPPQALASMGLDYATLHGIKPDLVVTQVSAYDTDGPDRDRGGYDGVGQSMSGAMHITGFAGHPCRAAVSYVDYATGISCAYGTLAALINRMKTGEGTLVQANLLATAMNFMAPIYLEEATGTRSRVASGNRSPIAGPSDLFATRDGWVLIQVIGEGMFRRWCKLVERTELAGDPRFATDQLRGDNGEALSAIMSSWCAQLTTGECLARLEAARIPVGRVLTAQQVIDPAAGFLDTYFDRMHFPGREGALPVPKVPARLRLAEAAPTRPAPRLGEHSAMVLADYGFTGEEITALRDLGVVA